MPLFYLAIPLKMETLGGLRRLMACPDFNIEIMVEASGAKDYQEEIIVSLKEVLVQAMIACDEGHNGSKN